jgi:hypothetical protein
MNLERTLEQTMKNTLSLVLAGILVAVGVAAKGAAQSQPQTQSLGDYAHAVKKTKPASSGRPAHIVYDNDNLPAASSLSVVGNATPASDAADKKDADKDADPAANKNADSKSSEKKDAALIKPGQAAEDREKALEAWKQRLDAQKDKIALLSRELDVLQREYQLKVATFYSDPAKRVQNPNGLLDDDAKYKEQVAEKQQALDDAKNELSNMQDEAHRAGAPGSVTE